MVTAREQAARIVAEAEARAQTMRDEIEAVTEEARQRGFDSGYAAGRDAALGQASEVVVSARAEAERTRLAAKDAAFVLARKMAEKIVARTVEISPDVIADIVGRALAAARPKTGPVTLRVAPTDEPTVLARRASWAGGAAELHVRVVADSAIEPGGCIVETPIGRLDAQVASQLDAFERALGGR